MSRFVVSVALAIVLAAAPAVRAADHILLSEFAVTPTSGEFVEIFNPTISAVDLTGYYVTDFVLTPAIDATQNYWRVADGALVPSSDFPNDFVAGFPPGTTIGPGQSIVIALDDSDDFASFWGSLPDFEVIQDGTADGVPDMVDPGLDWVGVPLIQSEAGLSNAREVVVLFYWDGESDLVQDVDIVQWGDSGPDFATVSPNKTGVTIDGPDAGTETSTYLPDTAPQGQDLASVASPAHQVGLTVTRIDFEETGETLTGGNGLLGHDETSEPYSVTWDFDTLPSLGSPGAFGPPSFVSARATAETELELLFSRAMDPVTSENRSNYGVFQVVTPTGGLVRLPLILRDAELDENGQVVRLETDPQTALATYEIQVSNLLTEDGSTEVIAGSRLLVRGFNGDQQFRLEVPAAPFLPDLENPMPISYVAPQGETVLVRVFDVEGRELFILADEVVPAGGLRTISWDGRDDLRQRLSAGVYYVHLEVVGRGERRVAPVVIAAAPEGVLR